jgi:hypothetical protein
MREDRRVREFLRGAAIGGLVFLLLLSILLLAGELSSSKFLYVDF